MVKDEVVEPEWKCTDVNEHWQQMKNIMMDTAEVMCGLSKGPCRHKETWWWNEEVAEAVREKKTRNRAVAGMADRTAPVVKLTRQKIVIPSGIGLAAILAVGQLCLSL